MDSERPVSITPFDVLHEGHVPLRILIVDDDEFDRRAVQRSLRQAGLSATVDEAASGADTLARIGSSTYHCIILDYYLPGEDGLSLLKAIRDAVIDVPVVIFTGRGDEEIAVELMKAGAVDYLPKASLTPERLISSVRHAMELARTAAARRRAEEDLRAQEARFRTLANTIPQMAWMADATGRRYWYNQRWLDYTGTTLEDVAGWGWQAYHHPDHLRRVTQIVRRSLDTGRSWEDTFPLRGRDGTYRWFLTRALPIHDDGGAIIGWIGTSTDITDQKQNEEERERLLAREQAARTEAEGLLRARDALVSFASHDLRTPLTVLEGHAQMLDRLVARDRLTAEALTAGLAGILAASKTMEALIEELMDVVRLQAGQQLELHAQPTDLVALAQRVATQQQRTTDRHVITVTSDLAALVGDWDPLRMERVLGNLISNAVKYSPEGGAVTITLVQRRRQDGMWVELAVQDQGIGIPDEDLPHLFTRFHRAANVTGSIAGSGIGLAGAKHVIEQHGGSLTVESGEGVGSTFTIYLPLVAPAEGV